MYKRVLLKISGESLLGEREYGIDPTACMWAASEIKKAHETGTELAVALGGGNIFRGLSASQNGIERAVADYIGMLATVMNALAFQNALEKIGLETRVLSSLTVQQVCEPYIRRRALRHMDKGRVVILAAGIGNPYFTSDTGAVLRALELECDIVLKATKVDGVYDKDPKEFDDATKYDQLTLSEALNRHIKVMDSSALAVARDNKLPIRVFNFFEDGNVERVLKGDELGTLVTGE